ncbi:hypothetical protein Zmor_009801 [Zophobas morio]|uniref:Uncharacterized protein n=1 Tax=Zophobas morio TaxID=2755281 RepID=A0AA38IJQ9_9CUCU|nr:hypothetical protein Zmor_009801 [Zophobas morio]
MNTCQFIVLCAAVAVSAAENWAGPLADHRLGQLVQDTPEVAAAKRQHALAFMQIRSLVPESLSEEYLSVDEPQLHHEYFQDNIPVGNPQDAGTRVPWKGPFADHKLGQQVPETPEVAAARKYHEEVYSKVRAILPELPPEKEGNGEYEDDSLRGRSLDVRSQYSNGHFVLGRPQASPQYVMPTDLEGLEAVRQAHARAVMDRIALLNNYRARVPATTPLPVERYEARSVNYPVDTSEVAAAKLRHAKAIAAVLGQ